MGVQYRIGEFASLSGVSPKTLRFYDEIGLLRPASIDSRTRYRHYLPQQLEELASIIALKNLGLPLNDIRAFVGKRCSAEDRRNLLRGLKKTVEQSIHNAKQSLDWINDSLAELERHTRPIPIIVKCRPEVLIASLRSKLKVYPEVLHLEQELLGFLPPESVGNLRGVLWHRCADSGSLEGEPFVGLKQKIMGKKFFDMKTLPAATLACAYSQIDDESSEQTYIALRHWMNVRGYRLAGPKREIYLDNILEIQFPLSLS